MFRSLTSFIIKSSEREDKLLPDAFLCSLASANRQFIKSFNSGISR
jgi:hypothetical protein